MPCAEKILQVGIKRVVFLNEYYDLDPIKFLESNVVLVRKAGK